MTNETIYLYRQDSRSGDLVIKFLHLPKYCCFIWAGRAKLYLRALHLELDQINKTRLSINFEYYSHQSDIVRKCMHLITCIV